MSFVHAFASALRKKLVQGFLVFVNENIISLEVTIWGKSFAKFRNCFARNWAQMIGGSAELCQNRRFLYNTLTI